MSSQSNTIPDPSSELRKLACIALGANLPSRYGSPADTIQAAIEIIADWTTQPLLQSSLWSSSPVDCPPGSPDFVNGVIALIPMPAESPDSLLQKMQKLEEQFGRVRSGTVNAPRCLDLDLICFGDRQQESATLILPHPRTCQRSFVLLPLAEILPGLRLPGQSRTVRELAAELDMTVPGARKLST